MKTIPASELILNSDGSVFHLHLLPEQLADKVILSETPPVSIPLHRTSMSASAMYAIGSSIR